MEVPLTAVFEARPLASLARQIEMIQAGGLRVEAPPILPTDHRGDLPLSFAQERLWFLDQLLPGTATHNIPAALRLHGALDPGLLRRSLDEVVRRHAVLRTTFQTVAGKPVQVIAPALSLAQPLIDLRSLPAAWREAEAQRLVRDEAERPFDLCRGPLIRTALLRLEPAEHVVLLTIHHIVSDDGSMGMLVRELGALYCADAEGLASPLPELPVQYADFAVWQRQWLHGERLEAELSYWRQTLGGMATLELPTDRPRPPIRTARGDVWISRLSSAASAALAALGRQEGATSLMVLLALLATVLQRHSGQDDVAVGSPIANRNREEIENLIGCFANTLVLRTDCSGDPDFRHLLGRVRAVALGAFLHQDLPFERIVEELRPERDTSRAPLFQVMFGLEDMPAPELDLPAIDASRVEPGTSAVEFDLTLTFAETPHGVMSSWAFNCDLFDRATVARMAEHFEALAAGVAATPATRLSALPLLTEAEREQLLVEWNDRASDFPRDRSLPELFAEQVARSPQSLALVARDRRMTYGELDEESERLARRLRALGAGCDMPVGMMLERGVETVVATLAILKAGGAYVPLDPGYPQERLAFLLEDTAAPLVVTAERLRQHLPPRSPTGARVVCVDRQEEAPAAVPELPVSAALPDSLAYVIYTSGTTGQPKGVGIPHRGIVRLVRGADYVQLGPDDCIAQVQTTTFDGATFELWGALLNGACLALIDREVLLSPRQFGAQILALGVKTVSLTPELFHQMAREIPEAFGGLRHLFVGGELVDPGAVRRVLEQGTPGRLVHAYGPTECTTFAVCEVVHSVAAGALPIGRPIANTEAYVVDRWFEPAGLGVVGELCLGGDGLARGYLGRPEQTAERFVPDPWGEPGSRLYRTGDLSRHLHDGRLEFLGRIDHQVKIRGFRIEPGEIEICLGRHPAVEHAAVVVRSMTIAAGLPPDRRLAAYVVASGKKRPSGGELRAFVRQYLPEHMVPAIVVVLDALPRTSSGKVDRVALSRREDLASVAGGDLVPLQTPAEELLAAVWSELLGVAPIGREANFFELGGHSLLATQMVSRLCAVFEVEVPLAAVFEARSLAALARQIETIQAGGLGIDAPPIVRIAQRDELPLSFAQERLWFLEQLLPGTAPYNISAALRLNGALDPRLLRRSLAEIVRRHAVLRTTFEMVAGKPVQVIAPELPLDPPLLDLQTLPAAVREREAQRLVREEERRLFDISRGPLIRMALLRLQPQEHVALPTMHNIVSDGWSMGVLVRELGALYRAYAEGLDSPLPELPLQYGDFAVWQRQWLQGERLEAELAYWRRTLGGMVTLDLPTDRPRPEIPTFRGGVHTALLPAELYGAISRLARQQGATSFMVLLALLAAVLQRHTGQDDVAVGSPIANRNRGEIEGLIGFFVNTLVLRLDCAGDPSFQELLGRARRTALGASAHQDLPFEKIVQELRPERDLTHSPLFSVMLILQNAQTETTALLDLRPQALETESSAAKFDFTLSFVDSPEGLRGLWRYSRDLFDAATLVRLADHFEILAAAVVAAAGSRLSALPLLSAAEAGQITREWNDTAAGYPRDLSIPALFAAQVARDPRAVALLGGGEELTYAELDERANRLVARLLAAGVGPEVLVGLCFERSVGMIVALLAILKAGGAYVPLDPVYPPERLAFILHDTGMPVVLTEERLLARIPEPRPRILCVDPGQAPVAAGLPGPRPEVLSDSLAYVIYTSGSTGTPKGVAMPHQGILRLVRAGDFARFCPGDRVAQATRITFDVAGGEIWGALLNGGCLVLLDEELALAPRQLAARLAELRITTMYTTTALFEQIAREVPDAFRSLTTLIVGGEALNVPPVRRVLAAGPPERLINAYGPTEDTVLCVWYRLPAVLEDETPIPIGRPIANVTTCLLDRGWSLVPIGVPGELCLGGDGLARGYLGRPDLTAGRFVPNPFGGSGSRLYRTGDVARYRPDGRIEFLGRIDQQVKIRGFRIELGEIEAGLARHPAIAQAVVDVWTPSGSPEDRRLVAYLVARGDAAGVATPGAEELRGFLRERLPEPMVPAVFTFLDAMPLTSHGKVDRRALPAPDRERGPAGKPHVAPRDEVEARLAAIWEEVLGIPSVGIDDSFFDLGGHSLLAIDLMGWVAAELEQDLPVSTLFRHPTVRALAAVLRQDAAAGEHATLVPIQPAGEGTPFFCVHPVGGTVFCYSDLARCLGEERPFFGLQSSPPAADFPLPTLEELAREYLRSVREVQAAGPYLLGGWSMGAAVAFEMARQLRAEGEEIASLVLIDPSPLSGPGAIRAKDDERLSLFFAQDMAGLLGGALPSTLLQSGNPAAGVVPRLYAAMHAAGLLPGTLDLAGLERLFAMFKSNGLALQDYSPSPRAPYDGPATIFLADAPRPFDPALSWRPLMTGALDVQKCSGNHHTMLKPPHVQALAAKLAAALRR